MAMEHVVYGKPPGQKKLRKFASYPPGRWQWALKLANYLRDRGHADVVVEDEEEKPKKKRA
jgi:hypothetical protein